MLSMLFKEKLTDEQDEDIFHEFASYPLLYEHEIDNIDTKVTAYIGDSQIAQEKSNKMKAKGLLFISQIHSGRPVFHQSFTHVDNPNPAKQAEINAQPSYTEEQQRPADFSTPSTRTESKQSIRSAIENIKFTDSPAPPPSSPDSNQQFVTLAQLQELSNSAKDQLNAFSVNLSSRVDALSASVALAAGMRNDHSDYTARPNPVPNPTQPTTTHVQNSLQTFEFRAKNELIANGIRCEKCNKNIKNVEPITKLIMAVRDHVMEHFDQENPILKRYECRECPGFRTNFVDDFEKHLKRHGAMMSMPEKRQKLCVNLCTVTHLKAIADLCNKCFPEVFEKTPPAINTIQAIDTPLRAKVSVFPHLDRLYCTKFNIPYSCAGRSVHPLIRID